MTFGATVPVLLDALRACGRALPPPRGAFDITHTV
jgi:hypothetical protein